jgi:hypothetical protein
MSSGLKTSVIFMLIGSIALLIMCFVPHAFDVKKRLASVALGLGVLIYAFYIMNADSGAFSITWLVTVGPCSMVGLGIVGVVEGRRQAGSPGSQRPQGSSAPPPLETAQDRQRREGWSDFSAKLRGDESPPESHEALTAGAAAAPAVPARPPAPQVASAAPPLPPAQATPPPAIFHQAADAVRARFCGKCGNPHPEGINFCVKCGAPVELVPGV